MTDEKLGELLGKFADFYWSVPVVYVIDRISEWYPDLTSEQAKRVLDRCDDNIFWHHCRVEIDGMEEPELVAEHLVAFGLDNLERFIDARIDTPLFDCDERVLMKSDEEQLDIPEAHAIRDFGKKELGLDDEWAFQLVEDCPFAQANAFCDGKSWVMEVLGQEKYGKINFRTVSQVEEFRELGNRLYQVMPNPVLRGWKPSDIADPPVLLDDIPESDEDIPDGRKIMDRIFAPYGGRENVANLLFNNNPDAVGRKKRKIGRNELCPCGSGKKYKYCCGKKF